LLFGQIPLAASVPILGLFALSAAAVDELLIDDFADPEGLSRLGTPWRLVTDGVMGGVSAGRLSMEVIDERHALCMHGDVSLENNGGFVQVILDLATQGYLDASSYTGIRMLVRGNGESYNLHLKSADVQRPWQSYRSSFQPDSQWREIRLPFRDFTSHRIGVPLDTTRLSRLGLVAIGRAFAAAVCLAQVAFYRDRP